MFIISLDIKVGEVSGLELCRQNALSAQETTCKFMVVRY